jgi:hypothetical protein
MKCLDEMSSPRQWMIFVEWDASIEASQLVVMTNTMASMGQGAGRAAQMQGGGKTAEHQPKPDAHRKTDPGDVEATDERRRRRGN